MGSEVVRGEKDITWGVEGDSEVDMLTPSVGDLVGRDLFTGGSREQTPTPPEEQVNVQGDLDTKSPLHPYPPRCYYAEDFVRRTFDEGERPKCGSSSWRCRDP